MWAIVQRVILPLALLAAGIASVIYGEKRHVIPVDQEHEEEISIPISMPFEPGPPGPDGQALPQQPPGTNGPPGVPPMDGPPPFWRPPPMSEKVVKKVIVTIDEPESKIVREVSVGGVTRVASGEIKRTYSGDEGPALCPT